VPQSGQEVTLGPLATITFEVIFVIFLNASWMSCSVRVFSGEESVGDNSQVVFGQKFPGQKGVRDGALT
jgi:hypothetical protein